MKSNSAYLSAIFLAAATSLSSCTAVSYSLLPPAPVGREPVDSQDDGWTPYGDGQVQRQLPDRQIQETPGWQSAAVSRRDIATDALPPVERVEPVDPRPSADGPSGVDATKSQDADGWGTYRSSPISGADSTRPYSSRPVPKAPAKRISDKAVSPRQATMLTLTDTASRVEVDPTWMARNVPADMRREVNTMTLQAARAGSAKWIGLDGRNYSATAVQGMPGERCVEVTLGIGTDEQDDVGPRGNATVCPR